MNQGQNVKQSFLQQKIFKLKMPKADFEVKALVTFKMFINRRGGAYERNCCYSFVDIISLATAVVENQLFVTFLEKAIDRRQQ